MHLVVVFVALASMVECQNSTLINVGDILLSNCRLHPEISSPTEYSGDLTNVTIALGLQRFSGLDDIDEAFSFVGQLQIVWQDNCVSQLFNNGAIVRRPKEIRESTFCFNSERFWTPYILHGNSLKHDSLDNNNGVKLLCFMPLYGMFQYSFFNEFTSSCDFNFWSFPFDT